MAEIEQSMLTDQCLSTCIPAVRGRCAAKRPSSPDKRSGSGGQRTIQTKAAQTKLRGFIQRLTSVVLYLSIFYASSARTCTEG